MSAVIRKAGPQIWGALRGPHSM